MLAPRLPDRPGPLQSVSHGGWLPCAYVKHGLTDRVKPHLATQPTVRRTVGRMFDEDGNFTAKHLQDMGNRMAASIALSKQSKAAVAAAMGVSRAAMTQYCDGLSTPSLQRMTMFCKLVKTPIDYIVTGTTPETEDFVVPFIRDMIDQRRGK